MCGQLCPSTLKTSAGGAKNKLFWIHTGAVYSSALTTNIQASSVLITEMESNMFIEEELFNTDPRSYTLELVEEGHDAGHLLMCALKYMSHDDVRDMLDCNELSPRFDEDYEDSGEYCSPRCLTPRHRWELHGSTSDRRPGRGFVAGTTRLDDKSDKDGHVRVRFIRPR